VHDGALKLPPAPASLHDEVPEGEEGGLPLSVTVAAKVVVLLVAVVAGFGVTVVAVAEVGGGPLTT
jgi:hypothetical protein